MKWHPDGMILAAGTQARGGFVRLVRSGSQSRRAIAGFCVGGPWAFVESAVGGFRDH